jgi:hypothetical protein
LEAGIVGALVVFFVEGSEDAATDVGVVLGSCLGGVVLHESNNDKAAAEAIRYIVISNSVMLGARVFE